MALQAEQRQAESQGQQEEDQFGPMLVNRLEVNSKKHAVKSDIF